MNLTLRDADSQTKAPRSRAALPTLLLLALLWFSLCRNLSNEWSINEQYYYGWFVPFLALFLFWLRWEDRPTPGGTTAVSSPLLQPGQDSARLFIIAAAIGILSLLLLLPIRFFGIAAPDWRPLDWIHAAAVVSLTLLAAWIAGGNSWVRHFAFPAAFIFVAVPWLDAIEVPIVQGMMRIVAAVAAESLSLMGIPTQLEGSLIRVGSGVVGVSEACSGVRSLQTSLMIGLLFGELNRFRFARRMWLLIAAMAIAMAANLFRTMFLVSIAAQRGVEAVDQWHDFAGYSIVAAVFLGTIGLAAWLKRGHDHGKKQTQLPPPQATSPALPGLFRARLLPLSWLLAILLWLGLIEAGATAWYWSHERNVVPRLRWGVTWPQSAREFRNLPLDEKLRHALRFDEGRAATWKSPQWDPVNIVVLYFFRWQAGRGSILRARAHRPDICLPSIGWKQLRDDGIREYSAGRVSLPFRHFEFVHPGASSQPEQFAHAFYCVEEDLIRASGGNPTTMEEISALHGLSLIPHLWRLVRSGERPLGQQMMQVVYVGDRPTAAAIAEAHFAAMIGGIVALEARAPGVIETSVRQEDR